MVNNLQKRTASACSQELLEALRSGSNERVERALDEIAALSVYETPDTRESEFRDMLAGLAEPIAQGVFASPVSIQMLRHVAEQGTVATAPSSR